MELREKLETIQNLVDPETVLDHLMTEISDDIRLHQDEFAQSFEAGDLQSAASACVKMQYLEKLMCEAEQIEAAWID